MGGVFVRPVNFRPETVVESRHGGTTGAIYEADAVYMRRPDAAKVYPVIFGRLLSKHRSSRPPAASVKACEGL